MRIDFHVHTLHSQDSITPIEKLIAMACKCKIDKLVVTDHNTILGALDGCRIKPEMIIVGEEIMTTKGEILAAFVKEEIPPRLSPIETIHRLQDQEAFISISHPFDRLRSGSWREDDLNEIVREVDAIEVFNARSLFPGSNQRSRDYAKHHHLCGTAGSDAHVFFELGSAYLDLPDFNNVEGLRKVIREGKIEGHPSPFWVHFFSRYASILKKVV